MTGIICNMNMAVLFTSLIALVMGDFAFQTNHIGISLVFWITGIMVGFVFILKKPEIHHYLKSAKKINWILLVLIIIGFVFPILSFHLDSYPKYVSSWDFIVISAIMDNIENPGSHRVSWMWREGISRDSKFSPFDFPVLNAWCRFTGISIFNFRFYYLSIFILSLIFFYWMLARMAGNELASLSVMVYGVSYWTLLTVREINYIAASLAWITIFMAIAWWTVKGNHRWSWVPLGLFWGIGFYFYAPCRLMGIVFWGWVIWEFAATHGKRPIKLLITAFLATFVAGLTFTPNILELEKFQQHRQQYEREHVFSKGLDTIRIQNALGDDVKPPFSVSQKFKAIVCNSKRQIRAFIRIFAQKKLLLHPGLMIMGFIITLFSKGLEWKRPLIIWVFIGLSIPILAVGLYHHQRLILLQTVVFIFQMVPLAVALTVLKSSSIPHRRTAMTLFLSLLVFVIFNEIFHNLNRQIKTPNHMIEIAKLINRIPGQCVVVSNSHEKQRHTLWTETFRDRENENQSRTYHWITPNQLPVMERRMHELELPAHYISPINTNNGNKHWIAKPFNIGSKSIITAWKTMVIDARNADIKTGCDQGRFDGVYFFNEMDGSEFRKRSKFMIMDINNPIIQHKKDSTESEFKTLGFGFKLPVLENSTNYSTVICFQYLLHTNENQTNLNVNIRLDDHPASIEEIEPSKYPTLSAMIELNGILPGDHMLEIRPISNVGYRMTIWHMLMFYRSQSLS